MDEAFCEGSLWGRPGLGSEGTEPPEDPSLPSKTSSLGGKQVQPKMVRAALAVCTRRVVAAHCVERRRRLSRMKYLVHEG